MPLLPRSGTRTESIFCGTTLFAAEAATSTGCQHIRCPITPAMRQKILRLSLFPLPSTVHLPTRFSLRSQLCGTLCGCAADFTSVSTVSYLRYAYYTPCVSTCQELFSPEQSQRENCPPDSSKILHPRKHCREAFEATTLHVRTISGHCPPGSPRKARFSGI